jgi:histidyl-tRNA synthetase
MITRVRGTEDILDLTLYNFILGQAKKHLQIHNFLEIDTPILEHTKLFLKAVGEQTDIVSKEMYVFSKDGDEDTICLRPEITASIIRAYFENGIQQHPWKVFAHGPVFRKERPQKGRWRQFTQLSVELIAVKEIEYDAYFIKMLDAFVSDVLKLENYAIKLNFLGCSQDRKNHRAALIDFLEKQKCDMCQTCIDRKDKNPLRVLDCKTEKCKQILQKAPKLLEFLCTECAVEWEKLTTLLNMLSVSYVIDHCLVRGLDYYNKTVFEFVSGDLGAQNAFCGGGRYALGSEIGYSEDVPCIGVGFGMGRLLMLVEQNKDKLVIPTQPTLHVIIPMSPEQKPLALMLASELQEKQLCTEIILANASMTNLMKRANKLGAKFVLILGENEQKDGTVSIKNMQTGQSSIVKQAEVVAILR